MSIRDINQDAEQAFKTTMNPTDTFLGGQVQPYQTQNLNVIPRERDFFVDEAILDRSATQLITNNSSVPQLQTVNFNETTTDTTSTSVTHGAKTGLTLGYEASFGVNVGILSASQKFSIQVNAEYNFSTTTTQTRTVARGWNVTQQITTPPHSKIVATLEIYKVDFDIPIDLSMDIIGHINPNWGPTPQVYFGHVRSSPSSTGSWAVAPRQLVLVDPSSYRPMTDDCSDNWHINCANANWRGSATTRVEQGIIAITRIDEIPLSGYPGETRTYYLPPTFANPNQILTPGSLGNEIQIINPTPNPCDNISKGSGAKTFEGNTMDCYLSSKRGMATSPSS
jgi:hypothetical protein